MNASRYLRPGLVIAAATFGACVAWGQAMIANPMIPGDWSDPPLLKVGGDFYTLRSSFGWQPGLPIAHSRDLVHWRYIGHVFDSREDIRPGDTRNGVWGADMGYNPNTRRFLVYAPMRDHSVSVYHADRAEGPYSMVKLGDQLGIDPGFFADADGRLYLVLSRAVIYELEPDGLSIRREVVRLDRTRYRFFEGPSIVRRGDWYHLLFSDGGTLPGEPSTVSSLRARALDGPWEDDPGNPILFSTGSGAQFEGPAHGTLVEVTPDRWFVAYHAHEPRYDSLGRQMLLSPVEWTDDGWWRVTGGRIPETAVVAPGLPEAAMAMDQSDEFDGGSLGLQWFFLCPPDRSGSVWSLASRPGVLRVYPTSGDTGSLEALPAIVQQRVTDKSFAFETTVEFAARQDGECAGLHLYHDPLMNLWLGSSVRGGRRVIEVGRHNLGEPMLLGSAPHPPGDTVQLRIEVDGEEGARFFFRPDDAGAAWVPVGEALYFGASGHDLRDGRRGDPDLGWVGRYKDPSATPEEVRGRAGPRLPNRAGNTWTATTFGVFAVRGSAPAGAPADFHYLRVTKP